MGRVPVGESFGPFPPEKPPHSSYFWNATMFNAYFPLPVAISLSPL
jgi:hypothetical protein